MAQNPQVDLITRPFAVDGDKTEPPQTDPNNFVNFDSGYTSDYEINLAANNPRAKAVDRQTQNYLFNLLTACSQMWQQQAFPPFQANMPGGYDLNAIVIVKSPTTGNWIPYRSLAAGNVTTPGSSATWEYFQGSAELITNIPMPSGGPGGRGSDVITVATDFNTFNQNGTWEIISDAIAGASPNAPSAATGTNAGMLEVKRVPNGAAYYILQRYLDRAGVIFTRTCTTGAWTGWKVIPDLTQVSAGRYAAFLLLNTNTTLQPGIGGGVVQWNGPAGGAITLPLAAQTAALGGNGIMPITIFNNGAGPISLLANPSGNTDYFLTYQGTGLKVISLQVGDSIKVLAKTNNEWDIVGGTAAMLFVVNPQFPAGTAAFASRPTFAGKVPWDGGNFDPTTKVNKAGDTMTGGLTAPNITASGGNVVLTGWNGSAAQGVLYFGPPANNTYQYFDGSNMQMSLGPANAKLFINGAAVWNTANLPSPMSTTGGTFSGQVDHNNPLRMLNANLLQFWSPGNTGFGSIAGYAGGVGFLNQGQSAWNLQIADGGVATFRARPTWAGLTPWDSGNFNPNAYQLAGNYARLAQYNAGDGFGLSSGSPPSIAAITSQTVQLVLQNQGNNSASCVINFRREGSFAAYFGLDTDNQWKVGGGSYGATSYVIWHQGNFNPAAYQPAGSYATAGAQVQWGSGISELAGVVTGADVTVDAGGPWVLEGLRTNGGNNRIFMRVVWLRNQ